MSLTAQLLPRHIEAAAYARVYLDMPSVVFSGDNFNARIMISNVNNLKAFQAQIDYDPALVRVIGAEGGSEGVSSGLVNHTEIKIDMWKYYPAGSIGPKIRITGWVEGDQGAYGSGYLAQINFKAVAKPGLSAALSFSETSRFQNLLFDSASREIGTLKPWGGDSIQMITPVALSITAAGLPRGAAGNYYTAALSGSGGYPPYTWQAAGMPAGLSMSSDGNISGVPLDAGHFNVVVTLRDSYSPPNAISQIHELDIFQLGDADENGVIDRKDLRRIGKMFLGLVKNTPAADVDGDGRITARDAVLVQYYYTN